MTVGLLSQMENVRLRKEKSLKMRGSTRTMIVIGSIFLVVCILLFAFTGLLIASQGRSASSEEGTSSGRSDPTVYIFCASISLIICLIGFIMVPLGTIRRVNINHELATSEEEYQKLRLQIIALEERESPQDPYPSLQT